MWRRSQYSLADVRSPSVSVDYVRGTHMWCRARYEWDTCTPPIDVCDMSILYFVYSIAPNEKHSRSTYPQLVVFNTMCCVKNNSVFCQLYCPQTKYTKYVILAVFYLIFTVFLAEWETPAVNVHCMQFEHCFDLKLHVVVLMLICSSLSRNYLSEFTTCKRVKG